MTPLAPAATGLRRIRPIAALGWALGAASVVRVTRLHVDGTSVRLALCFGALVFIGELARVVVSGDREIAPVAIAGSLGYALTFQVGGEPARPDVLTVAGVTAIALVAGAAVHGAVGRPMRLDSVGLRILTVAAATAAFDALTTPPLNARAERLVGVMCAVVVGSGALLVLLSAVERCFTQRTPLPAALADETRAVAGIGAAIAATGVLIALSMTVMRLWALPALSLPLLVAQVSLRRYSGIRVTYRQTIRALSKVTEVGGYVHPGHSQRVAALAVATGRELGMTEAELLDLEYAALMHDIGQLSLAEPIAGGSTLTVPPQERRRIAELGAEVIRSSQALDRVATIVERQADPYRRSRHPADPTLPLESRIIKAASAYDDVVGARPDDAAVRADALERLRLGMAYEYDPRVVEALARVVARIPLGAAPALSA
jgi:hypothetical protein